MDFGVSTPLTVTGGGGVAAAGEEPPPQPSKDREAQTIKAAHSRFFM